MDGEMDYEGIHDQNIEINWCIDNKFYLLKYIYYI